MASYSIVAAPPAGCRESFLRRFLAHAEDRENRVRASRGKWLSWNLHSIGMRSLRRCLYRQRFAPRLVELTFTRRATGYRKAMLDLTTNGLRNVCHDGKISLVNNRAKPLRGTISLSFEQKVDQTDPRAAVLTLAHSPDSDDAFMFYAMATGKIDARGLSFTHRLEDIESLNRKALEGIYDITAISFHAYPYLEDKYVLLPSGASFGDRYGPVVVSREGLGAGGLKGRRVAVPGKMTTAYLVLQLYEPDVDAVVTSFDQILDTVAKDEADAGVVIHEGQLTYADAGLRKVLDLGEWWFQETQLPLPLGGNAIRRSLDSPIQRAVAALLKASIQYALHHREEALSYAQQFSRGLDGPTADRFVSMYVNDWTLDYGPRGRLAVQTLLDRGFQRGILPRVVNAEYVE